MNNTRWLGVVYVAVAASNFAGRDVPFGLLFLFAGAWLLWRGKEG